MRTIPLHGAKAAARVALVDDEDYGLVIQYRWFVYEKPPTATSRGQGPYAIANVGGKINHRTIRMHNLIMGRLYIDHRDHDGLNNQRYNLRPATHAQNMRNTRGQVRKTSGYKGVYWSKREKLWQAAIKISGKFVSLRGYPTEIEAAYAYDAAAREAFGEFACTNFPGEPTEAVRAQWEAENEAHEAAMTEIRRACGAALGRLWEERQPETRICVECGKEYQSRSTRSSYCGMTCRNRVGNRRRQQRIREGRLL